MLCVGEPDATVGKVGSCWAGLAGIPWHPMACHPTLSRSPHLADATAVGWGGCPHVIVIIAGVMAGPIPNSPFLVTSYARHGTVWYGTVRYDSY